METLKILIPTDFSVQVEYAYIMVQKLAAKINVDVHFLHVLSVPDTVSMDAEGRISTCGEIDVKYIEQQVSIANRNLLSLKSHYGEAIQTHLQLGKVTDTIIQFATEQHFDLIVMGTKGAWGIKEKVSGTETQMIARKSQVPLLSLMCDRSDLAINHLLLVHDFSSPKAENLTLMHKILNAFNPTLHLLQIVSGEKSTNTDSIEANMKQFASFNCIDKFECHVISDTDVENGVIHFNQMHNMDMICIGTHGKGGILHQSAMEKMVNHLFKPIISFQLK
ncbi:universal stress protein [Sediminibacterium sp. TEGAF015]|uniref:universal stress protein n=1 Tax=Sediminibacterium sp. TEGAF015 TaxID=575378 RepID=UPI0021FB66DA|nr:universal stress protein [Sediminibacterium sp. TEGAF015]BDQ11124.1 universal stress protein UspA [Sediminibacterium sp. TEGAF015]